MQHLGKDNKDFDAATSNNPQLRYVIGNDAARMMEVRKNISDTEFGNLIKKQFGI